MRPQCVLLTKTPIPRHEGVRDTTSPSGRHGDPFVSAVNIEWRRVSSKNPKDARSSRAHFVGCLLGGAVGDALGAPVEFLGIHEIRARYGAAGIVDYDVAYGRRGAITDDTQMTLFTAEGLLRATSRWHDRGICHTATVLHHAYIRWLHTQGERSRSRSSSGELDGWLIGVEGLHATRAPGNTCVTALKGDTMGTLERPLNDSKGCGGVMRVAPVGLVAQSAKSAFDMGCQAAAITHGHPSGYYSAGCFAAILQSLTEGRSLPDAIEGTQRILEGPAHQSHEECSAAIRHAVALWRDPRVVPCPQTIELLGGGWVGEEALAIALYCGLSAQDDFASALRLAVNHSGDSDSTGAMTGNLVGLMLGVQGIPVSWLDELELRDEITALAGDLHAGFQESDDWWLRYPGW